jgi:outer membrane biosynthesis protein TonB
MSCQETREKLSALADNELSGEERERVRGHLAGCPSCSRELQDQGALDMLLKSCFVKDPPDFTLDGIWPTVSDRVEGESAKGNGGGNVRDGGDIVFKSSSAMQMLRIPEGAAPAQSSGPTAAAPAKGGWAWPVALVVSSAILAGGFLLYKHMNPAAPDAGEAARLASAAKPAEPAPTPTTNEAAAGAASQPTAAAPSTQESPEVTPSGVAVAAAERKHGAKAKRAGKGVKVAAVTPGRGEGKAEKSDKPEQPKAEPAPKPAAKKGADDLDNLIDTAIGGSGAPSKKKAKKEEAAPKAPSEDLPEQLSMNQIRGAMNKIKGLVQACYDKYQIEGEARVSFTINPDGSVGDCSIKGKFFGTDTGTCVVNAVKKARFPKFSGKAIAIPNYPFMLQ